MINTGNTQLDALIADLQAHIQILSERAAAHAGENAVLKAKIAELEKPAAVPATPS